MYSSAIEGSDEMIWKHSGRSGYTEARYTVQSAILDWIEFSKHEVSKGLPSA
jgi:hypothetical protein